MARFVLVTRHDTGAKEIVNVDHVERIESAPEVQAAEATTHAPAHPAAAEYCTLIFATGSPPLAVNARVNDFTGVGDTVELEAPLPPEPPPPPPPAEEEAPAEEAEETEEDESGNGRRRRRR